MRATAEEAAELVGAASSGSARAWEQLVDTYGGLVWSIARGYRLNDGDAADVSQTIWLRLVENLDRLQDPSRVGAWLATTTRRECLRVLGQSRRLTLVAEVEDFESAEGTGGDVDSALLAAERAAEVRDALATLPLRSQQLMVLLMMDPPPSYAEISRMLQMPIGSIGPTRGRCVARLREILGDERIAESGLSILHK
jgi:RNA polymerase sigma factor (sigma-70 family)